MRRGVTSSDKCVLWSARRSISSLAKMQAKAAVPAGGAQAYAKYRACVVGAGPAGRSLLGRRSGSHSAIASRAVVQSVAIVHTVTTLTPLAGTLSALFLAKHGFKVDVYERVPLENVASGASVGPRSYNILLVERRVPPHTPSPGRRGHACGAAT
jgi:hypothetical protein